MQEKRISSLKVNEAFSPENLLFHTFELLAQDHPLWFHVNSTRGIVRSIQPESRYTGSVSCQGADSQGREIKAIDESINASPATAPSRFVPACHMLAINRESGREREKIGRKEERKKRERERERKGMTQVRALNCDRWLFVSRRSSLWLPRQRWRRIHGGLGSG